MGRIIAQEQNDRIQEKVGDEQAIQKLRTRVRLRFIDAGLLCLFGVFASAAIKFALNQTFKKFGHSDVIILCHLQHQNLGLGGDPKLNFLGFFPNEFWH